MKFRFLNSNRQVVKASYFNAIIVIVKALSGIITSKVVATFLGPSGLALLGNLRSFIQTSSSFTAEGYQNGTIRYVAEYSEDKVQKDRIIATVFQLSLAIAFIIGIVLWLFSSYWSQLLFQTDSYAYVIKILAVGLPFFSFNLLIIYILNGLENYKKLVIVNSVLSIVNMAVVVFCVIQYGLVGGLLGAIFGPVLVFIINLFALGKDRILLLNAFKFDLFSVDVLKNMNVYLLMTIYATAIASITFLLIRNLIIEKLGTQDAGYWEAMKRISTFYLMFFINLTSFYLLPRLSKTNDFKIFKKEIKGFYTVSVPLLLIGFVVIYFLRFFLLEFLLSKEFLPTSTLFFWHLMADFISVLAIALVKQFQAKLMVRAFLVCNGILNLLYIILSYFFIDLFGLVGVVKAYALSYLIYLILVITFIFHYYKRQKAI
ncbi:MAG: O-antigen translocase [Arcobacter sp.]|nr:O-antigen translocase [Arcobacter sp.]